MDLEILKKKLSAFKTENGKLTKVSDELLLEVLSEWELWTGTALSFYSGIGTNHHKMASMMGKAKKLKREGHVMPFQELKIEGITGTDSPAPLICDIELQENNKIIRFGKVDVLIEYLRKVA